MLELDIIVIRLVSFLKIFCSKNYMELKAKPEMKKQLHKERMFFWNKMIWEKRERLIEKKQLYVKTTQFLLNYQ